MQSARTGTFPNECETMINQLISLFWSGEQTYMNMSAASASDEISMLGFSEYFRLCCLRMRTIADKLCQFQTTRGGHLILGEVRSMIQMSNWNECTVDKLIHLALDMEKQFEQRLNELCVLAKQKNDSVTAEFVESTLLRDQVHVLKITVNHVNGLKVCENAWIYDTLTMKPFVRQICEMLGSGLTGVGQTCIPEMCVSTTSATGVGRNPCSSGSETCSEYLQSFVNSLRY
ncbi:unnamed protein product [Echinostoma caproni]|uniref:Ferritin n=1 Tax=Echinostoma caproni TaxID=27848 RepID=A0A183ADQ4_9TREM|nr:unnamed protein product [Echinostoma caproni]